MTVITESKNVIGVESVKTPRIYFEMDLIVNAPIRLEYRIHGPYVFRFEEKGF